MEVIVWFCIYFLIGFGILTLADVVRDLVFKK
jgi:hypothetical protein